MVYRGTYQREPDCVLLGNCVVCKDIGSKYITLEVGCLLAENSLGKKHNIHK